MSVTCFKTKKNARIKMLLMEGSLQSTCTQHAYHAYSYILERHLQCIILYSYNMLDLLIAFMYIAT